MVDVFLFYFMRSNSSITSKFYKNCILFVPRRKWQTFLVIRNMSVCRSIWWWSLSIHRDRSIEFPFCVSMWKQTEINSTTSKQPTIIYYSMDFNRILCACACALASLDFEYWARFIHAHASHNMKWTCMYGIILLYVVTIDLYIMVHFFININAIWASFQQFIWLRYAELW